MVNKPSAPSFIYKDCVRIMTIVDVDVHAYPIRQSADIQ